MRDFVGHPDESMKGLIEAASKWKTSDVFTSEGYRDISEVTPVCESGCGNYHAIIANSRPAVLKNPNGRRRDYR